MTRRSYQTMFRNWDEFLVHFDVHHDGVWGGRQRVYEFPNGYGASLVPEYVEIPIDENEEHDDPEFDIRKYMKVKKGFWEIAVLKNGAICYDTSITNDVLRNLRDPDVDNILGKISRL